MKINIDNTMKFLESDIIVDMSSLDSPLLKLGLFVVTMSIIVGSVIYRWNINRD